MPYATPTASPVSPPTQDSQLPPSHTQAQGQGHSQPTTGGRPGHRRSYTHSHITMPTSNAGGPGGSFASTSSSMGSLPRRRSVSHVQPLAHTPTTTPTPTRAQAQAQAQATPRKPTFQLGNGDDDDSNDSNEDDAPPKPSFKPFASERRDEDDTLDRRGLPPLRLKVKTASFSELDGLPQVPFPRSSPRNSPRGSPLHSPSGVGQGISGVIPTVGSHLRPPPHVRSASEQAPPLAGTPAAAANAASANANLIRPQVSRTISSPVLLLSNGKPLRSSLKGSSSSPNIPFPSQSLVPSIMWPDLHRPHHHTHQHHHHQQQHHRHHLGPGLAHERAASAPSTPHLDSAPFSPPSPPGSIARSASHPLPPPRVGINVTFPSISSSTPSSPTEQDPSAPPPSLTSSISSLSSSTSPSNSASSSTSPSSSPPHSPSSSYSSSTYTYPYPHAPKNVHFPSQDTNLATVKIFNRSARPASLSTPRMGEETETETEGEGSGTGGSSAFGGFGPRWGVQWGSVGYPFPRVGSGSGPLGASTAAAAGGQGNLPRRNRSPLRVGSTTKSLDADNDDDDSANEDVNSSSSSSKTVTPASQLQMQKEKEKEKGMEVFYALNMVQSSFVPMRADDMDGDLRYGAGNGHVVGEGNVYFESVGFARAKVEGAFASSSSATPPPPSRPLTLTGTLLVRNITYAKTVAVRFTMDDWHTTNDVLASYECSLSGIYLPAGFGRGRERVKDPLSLDSDGDENVNVGAHGTAGNRGRHLAPNQKGWDRFRFTINLEDYAASGTLEERTMWLVGRYTAGVDVRERVASLSSSGSASSLSSLTLDAATNNNNNNNATSSSTTTGTGTGDGDVDSASEAMLNDLPLPPSAQEWWDNNAGRNYKISFRKVYVPIVGPAADASTAASSASTAGLASASTNVKVERDVARSEAGGYRRGVIVSAPSSYSYTPPIGTNPHSPTQGSKSYPAPPQISSSVSFPGSGSFQSTGIIGVNSGMTDQQKEQHRQHHAALTQSTVARLKKLNLRNYAAPKPAAMPSPSSIPELPTSPEAESTSAFNTASRDLTPIQTPRDETHLALPPHSLSDDVPLRRSGEDHDEDRTPTFPGAVAPSWGGGGMSMENGFPATMMSRGMNPSMSNPAELGTSPPFSAMGDMDLGMAITSMKSGRPAGERGDSAAPGTYWPWGSFGDGRIEGQTQKENHMQDQDRNEGGNGNRDDDDVASATERRLLMDIKARSTSPVHTPVPSLSSASASGQMSLPHRRRKEPSGFSLSTGRSSPSGSQSGSPSGSGSDSSKASSGSATGRRTTGNGNGSGTAMWNGINRPGSPLLRTPSGLGSPALTSSASPFRLSPIPSPLSSSSSTPPPGSSSSPASPAATPDDAVYQAFVRQWCFAQAPGPTVGSGVGPNGANSARGSPGTASPSPGPGSHRTAGEFAEGPRLIVG